MAHPTFRLPEALRLAAELDPLGGAESEAAAELRRLYALNQELVEALKFITDDVTDRFDMEDPSTNPGMKMAVKKARAALAKASGSATQTGEQK